MPPAKAPIDLPPSAGLSIIKRGPQNFAGRKLGLLLTDGADAGVVQALIAATEAEGALYEVVAPHVAGVTLSDGSFLPGKQKVDGGPSVLYDAVAVVVSAEGAPLLAMDKTAKDFVSDAYAHCKFMAYVPEAQPFLERAGVTSADLDEGVIALDGPSAASAFLAACGQVRLWAREAKVDLDAIA